MIETDWHRDPDVLERIVHAALGKGDVKGVEGALTLMAVCDPGRAQRLVDELKAALAVASWRCPVAGHEVPTYPDVPAVELFNGAAYCAFPRCGRSSVDESGCNCDGDDLNGNACAGQCCGKGACSCSPTFGEAKV